MTRAEVARAVDALVDSVSVPAHNAAWAGASGRRHIARRRGAIVAVTVVAIATIASVGAATHDDERHRQAARGATVGGTDPTFEIGPTAPFVAGGIIGCPQQPLTAAKPGDPPPGVVPAAINGVSAHSLWTGGSVSAVYQVGSRDAGAFGADVVANIASCGREQAYASWVVELHHPGGAQLSAVVLAHYADGWHVFGRYP